MGMEIQSLEQRLMFLGHAATPHATALGTIFDRPSGRICSAGLHI